MVESNEKHSYIVTYLLRVIILFNDLRMRRSTKNQSVNLITATIYVAITFDLGRTKL